MLWEEHDCPRQSETCYQHVFLLTTKQANYIRRHWAQDLPLRVRVTRNEPNCFVYTPPL